MALTHSIFEPDKETVSKHQNDSVAMKACPEPTLILIPSKLYFSFFMKLFYEMAAVSILYHHFKRSFTRKIAPVIFPFTLLISPRSLSYKPAYSSSALSIYSKAAHSHKLRP